MSARQTKNGAAAIVAAGALVLTGAGCGGGSPVKHAAGGSSRAVAFSHCMRAHGVLNFPDPSSSGVIPKVSLAQLAVSSSRFETANGACRHLLPTPTAARQRLVAAQSLSFSRCVRAHGVPNFPDPDSTGRIPDPASVGIDQGSPRFEAANRACGRYRPPYMPSNAAYNSWAKSHGG
ncbi:MAG TPA: hypothetical protein VFA97_11330 [Gaiellaceae bacterium]|nr:hypothetical protein [Gaiellaceae bacterium]